MIKTYYMLTKPGIIFGNLITAIGGFALGSMGRMNYALFLATLIGLGCVIASSCVFNNYIDRYTDKKMARTQNRPLVKGVISIQSAIVFAILLGLAGVLILALWTNLLTVVGAIIGFFFYVIMYSLLKYFSSHATLIGSISGAMPPVIGYCAASNRFDIGAIILFAILVLWQMPHFFAIAMYRFDDYAAASIPVLPVKKGMYVTKVQMVVYIVAFIVACLMLTAFGYMGYIYAVVTTLIGVVWLVVGIKGFKSCNDKIWARKMFVVSLVVIMVLCTVIALESQSEWLKNVSNGHF
jgi:heme o synthase